MQNLDLKRIFIGSISFFLLIIHFNRCSSPTSTPENPEKISNSNKAEISYQKKNFRMIEGEKIQIDTLYIQVAYEITPERWVVIAESVNDDPKGLRLLLVNPKKNYELIYKSNGAYESMTLHPQFFIPNDESPWILLCAIGQMESWGQILFFMDGDKINEIAYMDVAIKQEADSEYYESGYKLTDISEVTSIYKDKNGIHFNFETDSIKYFGTLEEILDPVLSGDKVSYTFHNDVLEFQLQN